jgi:stress-induced morphogen
MSEVLTAPSSFAQRIEAALLDGLKKVGIEAEVETEPVPTTLLYRVLVTSPQFAELSFLDRQEVAWRIVSHAFSADEKLHISSIWAATPNELQGQETAGNQ